MHAIYPKRGVTPVLIRHGMSTVVLREAGPLDDEAIGALLVDAFVSRYAVKMPEVTVTERRKAELRDVASKRPEAKVWVAESEGVVVGTVTMWPAGAERSEAWLPNTADLRQLAVKASHRGGQLSAKLLELAESWAKAQKYDGVCLHVRRGAHGVRALYEGRGYQRRPEGDLDLQPEVFLEAFFLPL
jgi:predicted N-acetyltransferase YhbS